MTRGIWLTLAALVLFATFTLGLFLTYRARDEAARAQELAAVAREQGAELTDVVVPRAAIDVRRSRATSAANGEVLAALARIEVRLAALEAEVGRTSTVGTSDRSSATTGPASSDDPRLTEVLAAVTDLQQALAAHVEEARGWNADARGLGAVKKENPDARWGELQKLRDAWHADEARATEEVRLLSPTDIVRRFGSPTEVWSNEKGTHWMYGQGVDPTGGHQHEVYLRFQDGYVTVLGVK